MKRTDSKTQLAVVKAYEEGYSMKKIGDMFDMNPVTVMNILHRLGIQTRTKGGIYALPQKEIIADYENGSSDIQLAKKYNVCRQTIDNVLNKHKIDRNRRYINKGLDVHYFSVIDSPDKAYFLGFLLTDGNVQVGSNNVRLQLHQKDQYILHLFAQVTGNTNKISLRKGRPHKKFQAKSQQWKQDLAKYGVVPRKTYSADMPILNPELMSHLIRGMIDGDGWVSCTDKSRCIGFCGAEAAVTHLRDYLVDVLGVSHTTVRHVNTHLWNVVWTSKKDILLIGNYIYADKGCFYLSRKYDKFLAIKQYVQKCHGNTEVSTQIAKGYVPPQSVVAE